MNSFFCPSERTARRIRKEIIVKLPAPTRKLAEKPDRDQLKRQAKELLDGFGSDEPDASKEVHLFYYNPDPATFAPHDAQLVLARSYGFDSWRS
jgi:hypothetical protein